VSFDVDIKVERGGRLIETQFKTGPGITALFGPSGAGKTSILQAIAGLLQPVAGHIIVNDQCLFNASTDMPAHLRRCGFIFQDVRLFPHLSVAANLRYGLKRRSTAQPIISFDDAVAFLGIGHLLERQPATLSGGEAQRVTIGRALLSAPRFLLMDEPLTSLDHARRDEIMELIEHIRDQFALPILYVSHDRAEVSRLADFIIELS
jgi:molybdate transport system ATP-binding protein